MIKAMGQLAVWGAFAVVCVVAVWVVFSVLYPAQLGFQRNAVEQSKSFTDSMNRQMVDRMDDWAALEVKATETTNQSTIDAIHGQQKQDVVSVCKTIATMQEGTVSAVVTQWVAQRGGCHQ